MSEPTNGELIAAANRDRDQTRKANALRRVAISCIDHVAWHLADRLEAALAEIDGLKAKPEPEGPKAWAVVTPSGVTQLTAIKLNRILLQDREILAGYRVVQVRVTVLPEEDAR